MGPPVVRLSSGVARIEAFVRPESSRMRVQIVLLGWTVSGKNGEISLMMIRSGYGSRIQWLSSSRGKNYS